jgi:FkbM family methyltransferase
MLHGTRFLRDLVEVERLSSVVDVGANPIDGHPPYLEMLRQGLCTVTGFEPQPEALAALERSRGPLETYLPDAIGDGEQHLLRVTAASGMASLLEPDPDRLGAFNGFLEWGQVRARLPLQTTRLDDVRAIQHMDMLKIDVQGAELMVFRGARNRLRDAVFVHTEVSFVPLYQDQPTFGDVDQELRSLDLIPHAIADLKRWPIAPVIYDGDFRRPMHQVLEADVVYSRDFTSPDRLTDQQLRHMALIAHCAYGSSDLVHRCLMIMRDRGLVGPGSPERYLTLAHPRQDRGVAGPGQAGSPPD